MDTQPWTPGHTGNAILYGSIDNPGVYAWITQGDSPHHWEVASAGGIGNFASFEIDPDGGIKSMGYGPMAAEETAAVHQRLPGTWIKRKSLMDAEEPMDFEGFGHEGSYRDAQRDGRARDAAPVRRMRGTVRGTGSTRYDVPNMRSAAPRFNDPAAQWIANHPQWTEQPLAGRSNAHRRWQWQDPQGVSHMIGCGAGTHSSDASMIDARMLRARAKRCEGGACQHMPMQQPVQATPGAVVQAPTLMHGQQVMYNGQPHTITELHEGLAGIVHNQTGQPDLVEQQNLVAAHASHVPVEGPGVHSERHSGPNSYHPSLAASEELRTPQIEGDWTPTSPERILADPWQGRTPFVYMPEHDTAYIGKPGQHHAMVRRAFGIGKDMKPWDRNMLGIEGTIMHGLDNHPDEASQWPTGVEWMHQGPAHVLDAVAAHVGLPALHEHQPLDFERFAAHGAPPDPSQVSVMPQRNRLGKDEFVQYSNQGDSLAWPSVIKFKDGTQAEWNGRNMAHIEALKALDRPIGDVHEFGWFNRAGEYEPASSQESYHDLWNNYDFERFAKEASGAFRWACPNGHSYRGTGCGVCGERSSDHTLWLPQADRQSAVRGQRVQHEAHPSSNRGRGLDAEPRQISEVLPARNRGQGQDWERIGHAGGQDSSRRHSVLDQAPESQGSQPDAQAGSTHANLAPWEPGYFGKLMITPEGKVEHWRTSELMPDNWKDQMFGDEKMDMMDGHPYHIEAMQALGRAWEYQKDHDANGDNRNFSPGWIHPDGYTSLLNGHERSHLVEEQLPWAELAPHNEYHFGGMSRDGDWYVTESDFDPKETFFDPQSPAGWPNRDDQRVVVTNIPDKHIIVGQPGTHHADLISHHGVDTDFISNMVPPNQRYQVFNAEESPEQWSKDEADEYAGFMHYGWISDRGGFGGVGRPPSGVTRALHEHGLISHPDGSIRNGNPEFDFERFGAWTEPNDIDFENMEPAQGVPILVLRDGRYLMGTPGQYHYSLAEEHRVANSDIVAYLEGGWNGDRTWMEFEGWGGAEDVHGYASQQLSNQLIEQAKTDLQAKTGASNEASDVRVAQASGKRSAAGQAPELLRDRVLREDDWREASSLRISPEPQRGQRDRGVARGLQWERMPGADAADDPHESGHEGRLVLGGELGRKQSNVCPECKHDEYEYSEGEDRDGHVTWFWHCNWCGHHVDVGPPGKSRLKLAGQNAWDTSAMTKGFVWPDGRVVHWQTDDHGAPYHADMQHQYAADQATGWRNDPNDGLMLYDSQHLEPAVRNHLQQQGIAVHEPDDWGFGHEAAAMPNVTDVMHPVRVKHGEDDRRPFIYDTKADHLYMGQPHGFHWDVINNSALKGMYDATNQKTEPPAALHGMAYGRMDEPEGNLPGHMFHLFMPEDPDEADRIGDRAAELAASHFGQPMTWDGGDEPWDFEHMAHEAAFDFENVDRTPTRPVLVMDDGAIHIGTHDEHHDDLGERLGLDGSRFNRNGVAHYMYVRQDEGQQPVRAEYSAANGREKQLDVPGIHELERRVLEQAQHEHNQSSWWTARAARIVTPRRNLPPQPAMLSMPMSSMVEPIEGLASGLSHPRLDERTQAHASTLLASSRTSPLARLASFLSHVEGEQAPGPTLIDSDGRMDESDGLAAGVSVWEWEGGRGEADESTDSLALNLGTHTLLGAELHAAQVLGEQHSSAQAENRPSFREFPAFEEVREAIEILDGKTAGELYHNSANGEDPNGDPGTPATGLPSVHEYDDTSGMGSWGGEFDNRRPMIYDARGHTLHIAWPGCIHSTLRNRMGERGFGSASGDRRGFAGVYEGWLGHNPEGNNGAIGGGDNDYPEQYTTREGEDGEYGWYARPPASRMDSINEALHKHFLATPDSDLYDFEKFGASMVPEVHEIHGYPMGSDQDDYYEDSHGNQIEDDDRSNWTKRRPLLYDTRHNKVFVGDLDTTHTETAYRASQAGHEFPLTDRHGTNVYHGWMGPNPSGDKDHMLSDENGEMISNEGHDNEYGWYTPLAPEHAQAAGAALRDHFGATPEGVDFDFEHFASYPPDHLPDEWNEGDPLPEWKPGIWGKGMFYKGQPYLWGMDRLSAPHHFDALDHLDPGSETGPDGYFHVHPDGTVDAEGHGDSFAFVKTHPGLKLSDRDYDFERYGAFEENNWPFPADEPEAIPPPPIHEIDTRGMEMGSPPGQDWADRRPLLYDTTGHRLFVGGRDVSHGSLINAAKRQGHYFEYGTGTRHNDEVVHGWMGPNPEGWDARGGVQLPDSYNVMGEFGWYAPLPQHAQQPIYQALAEHMNAHPEQDQGYDFERFAAAHLPVFDYESSNTSEGRTRAFLVGPNELHLGGFGSTHDDLHEEAGNHDYDWPAGWITPGNEVGFMQPLGDQLEKRIVDSLAHHTGEDIRGWNGFNFEHFAAWGDPLPATSFNHVNGGQEVWNPHPAYATEGLARPWEPGQEGKAIFTGDRDGGISFHTWGTPEGQGSGPHHTQVTTPMDKGAWPLHTSPGMELRPDGTLETPYALGPWKEHVPEGFRLKEVGYNFESKTASDEWEGTPAIYNEGNGEWVIGKGAQYHYQIKKPEHWDPDASSFGWHHGLLHLADHGYNLEWYEGVPHPEVAKDFEQQTGKPVREIYGTDEGFNFFSKTASEWTVIPSQTQDSAHYTDDPEDPHLHYPIIRDEDNKTLYLGHPGIHHADLEDEFNPSAWAAHDMVHPQNWKPGNSLVYWQSHRDFPLDPNVIKAVSDHLGQPITRDDGSQFDFESKVSDIDWERNDRPHIPELDDNPQAQAQVVYPKDWDPATAQERRTPFWVAQHPSNEEQYHILLGYPGEEHAGIWSGHDPQYEKWPEAASGGIKPKGSGWLTSGGEHTFDRDTLEFYNDFLPYPLKNENDYEDYQYNREDREREGNPYDPEWESLERRINEHSGRSRRMHDAVTEAINSEPHWQIGDTEKPDEYDFEKFGSWPPQPKIVDYPMPEGEEADWGYEGRRPILYHPPTNTAYIGADNETHLDFLHRSPIQELSLAGINEGWIGHNPESNNGNRIEGKGATELGWYDNTPQHIHDALKNHFNAQDEAPLDFEKFATNSPIIEAPDRIEEAHPLVYWPHSGEIRIGEPHEYHQELENKQSGGDANYPYGHRALARPGTLEWLYDEPPYEHDEVAHALEQHYGEPFESTGQRTQEMDFDRFGKVSMQLQQATQGKGLKFWQSRGGRQPFIVHPQTNSVYLGQPDTVHPDVSKEFGIDQRAPGTTFGSYHPEQGIRWYNSTGQASSTHERAAEALLGGQQEDPAFDFEHFAAFDFENINPAGGHKFVYKNGTLALGPAAMGHYQVGSTQGVDSNEAHALGAVDPEGGVEFYWGGDDPVMRDDVIDRIRQHVPAAHYKPGYEFGNRVAATMPPMQVMAFEHVAWEDDGRIHPEDMDEPDWYEELNDPEQLHEWKMGDEGKGILHTDGTITTWNNQKIHHQPVERFLQPQGKRTRVYLDYIHPDGTTIMEEDARPEDHEAVEAAGLKPQSMFSDGSMDFENFDLGDSYVGLNS